jgi:hypothetical protein
MLDRGDDGRMVWTFWHPKSDTEARISPAAILEHAHDMGALAARTLGVAHLAAQRQTATARPGQTP